MSDNKSPLPDVIGPVSNAIHQNLPETEHQIDSALSTVVGFFNNVVLYPVKKANLTFQYKLETFKDDMTKKISNIPPENIQEPPIMIAGPALEALRYAYDEKELREMYENLLASAMDNRKVSQVHPSYVDAIKQMNPLDAMILKEIIKNRSILSIHAKVVIPGKNQWFPQALPYHFCDNLLYFGDPFDISASISNLIRLGLVRFYNTLLEQDQKDYFLSHRYFNEIIESFPSGSVSLEINISGTVIMPDDYGNAFAKVCL